MAAPSNKFYTEDIQLSKSGYTTKNILIAIRGEYAISNADLKSVFKIDKLFQLSNGTKSGFVGAVISSGSNYQYHASSRLSGLKISGYNLLKDAGLNRMGDISANVTDRSGNVGNNSFTLTGIFKSAFYNSTTQYGFRWKKTTDSSWNTYQIGTSIAENSQVSITAQQYVVDATEFLYIEAPFTYDIQLYITNEEGTFYFDYLDLSLLPASVSLAYGTSAANAYAATPTTYYKSKKTLTTVVNSWIYSDSNGTTGATSGYYMDKANPVSPGQYRYYQVGSNGLVTNVGTYSVASRNQVPYSGYDLTSYSVAYNQAVANGWSVIGSIWWDSVADIYYTTQTGTTLANGYYMISENDGEVFYHYIIDGIKQN